MEAIKSTVETFLTNAGKETRDDTESYKYSASDAAAEAKEEVKDAAQSAKEKASNAADSVKQSAKETADAAERKTNEVSAKANNATTSSASASSTKTTGTARAGAVTGDVTVDKEVVEEAPVVHERVHKTIVDENQTIIDREHDVDHYKKKIQPIAVEQNQGTARQAGKETHAERKVDLEDDAATKAKLAAEDAKLKSTKDVDVKHEQVQKKDIVNEKEHHHLHERVQPVIEKDVYQKQVNKNVDHVHESVRDKAVVEETEVLPTKKQSEVNK
ncbi:hypothetical protein BCR37DRAFT_375561 [Protomyces lactucae-debilis]|uniref:Uncharacterized protein n=1 Tax=Protomyces lactucae-debilis TaxID=2754530 RepID=A0A1Y2FWL2_PROLT|nr:uncharacterized protein BCR37DRAFT_375561 [Protomyces lactucae-debilis]ORY87684.1 hypothetical protein BCR37DRAFT_375561 [Protomyces lactucae-debilis]